MPMLAELESSRLNVESKDRSNLFSWRGQFTPQFVDYLLETYANPGDYILDPFCGSGTVLQEAISHRLTALGLEINPAAYAMAKFFCFSKLSQTSRRTIIEHTGDILYLTTSRIAKNIPMRGSSEDYRESISCFIEVAKDMFASTADKNIRLLMLLSLFRAENSKAGNLVATLHRAFKFLSEQLICLPITDNAPTAQLADARSSHNYVNHPVDIIMTSPPYINVFNYHQNYRALLEIFGFDMLKVAHSEIGSNRKHRGNRFLTVIQYCLDIELALNSFSKILAKNGLLIMVLGRESRVRGIAFGNSEIVKRLIDEHGSFSNAETYERVFMNRFGHAIYEDILVTRSNGNSTEGNSARHVATDVLKTHCNEARSDVRANLEEALAKINVVCPSPVFNKADLI
jgi:16S rRNA G966 N2-methylase RsmD